jgi:hypothetical protein
LQRDELLDANTAIQAEWEIGKQGLLGTDHYLFFSRARVNEKSLPLKWKWLALVASARAAAAADDSANDTYNHERTCTREWLLRHNPKALRIRDGPKTTQKRKTQQKKTKNNKKINDKIYNDKNYNYTKKKIFKDRQPHQTLQEMTQKVRDQSMGLRHSHSAPTAAVWGRRFESP